MSSILEKFSLNGKVAVVTGAARGLGQGMALALAEAGADIVAVDILPADDTKKQVEALGRKAITLAANLGDRAAIPQVIANARKQFAHLDVLVNCAGIIRREDFTKFSEKDWDDVMGINIDAVFFLSQAFVRDAIERNAPAKIINIASMLSFQGGIRVPSYTASKSAVQGLTRLMANELAAKGINVNAIAPGYMATDNTAPLRADEKRSAAILERIPAARWGTPDDLKGTAVFLASSASDYVNGYTIAVDGGWLAR
ncbi:2-dehydro-3-deoxy-D-gluconate 5-dehydrogenase KduD [Opitutus terrae]|uniref:2-dehydro-3-deoxy-D-gluconate 5-dehydrogenase n=1 Tax=Opitutus terrae (strain DSM 11246 / JCM 15787 / PB90-1) TaxID=452637 RepID=B1ZP51_OPITP|nr:2-dehydro-3-deoxy-D-gluconate 5-dehydrogenase KduD [Opitutus terrae]ACB77537.1 2-deoxy-D-gluconate 3-dehydrogenase [Opitutus terrae PB90-1]